MAFAFVAGLPASAEARYKVTIDGSTPTTAATFFEASSTPNASDALVLRPAGPRMMHDRFDKGDSQFASDLNFDTLVPGNQYLPSSGSKLLSMRAGATTWSGSEPRLSEPVLRTTRASS